MSVVTLESLELHHWMRVCEILRKLQQALAELKTPTDDELTTRAPVQQPCCHEGTAKLRVCLTRKCAAICTFMAVTSKGAKGSFRCHAEWRAGEGQSSVRLVWNEWWRVAAGHGRNADGHGSDRACA